MSKQYRPFIIEMANQWMADHKIDVIRSIRDKSEEVMFESEKKNLFAYLVANISFELYSRQDSVRPDLREEFLDWINPV